ncbi:MAG: hypothetical protein GF350_01840 [Chitinivibrionales bacterium]|nr:hypothetical protein [Chitinivibrionales bacterium]
MQHLVQLIRTTPNKGRTHCFLGHPLSDGCDKTTVEPGNTFSPGVFTCGISLWIESAEGVFTPDLLPDSGVSWQFGEGDGMPPLVVSSYKAGHSTQVKHTLCHLGTQGSEGVDCNKVEIDTTHACSAYIVIRDTGPAGGKLSDCQWDSSSGILTINKAIQLNVEQIPDQCSIIPPDEHCDSYTALLKYAVESNEVIKFTSEHGWASKFSRFIPKKKPWASCTVDKALEEARQQWDNALPAHVFAPDPRISRAWEQCAFHILSVMECGLPRIGGITMPVFWLRDGIIILRALDLIGRHDLARSSAHYLAPLYFSGGFGAESDAPGEGIWSLVSHAQMTNDTDWLKSVFYHIRHRVQLIQTMRTTDTILRLPAENREPQYLNTPDINILCLPSQNRLIHGRMDFHTPDFYINNWASAGMHKAAVAAAMIGENGLSKQWQAEADDLDNRIAEFLLPNFSNERDTVVTPYPAGNLTACRDALHDKFAQWYRTNRLTPSGERKPEPHWTYFEAAQIHNALLLGMKDECWKNLSGMFDDHEPWNMSLYVEGMAGRPQEYGRFRNDLGCRGFLSRTDALGGNMPHNWTNAELINLIRDIFVCDHDERLVLGPGVPDSWLKPGAQFGVSNMPTRFGKISYTVSVDTKGTLDLDYKGPDNYECAFVKNRVME